LIILDGLKNLKVEQVALEAEPETEEPGTLPNGPPAIELAITSNFLVSNKSLNHKN
jgi:hypothetical protein